MTEKLFEFAATHDIPQRVAWGLLHSLWLVTLLGLIYGGLSLALTSRYARLRYLFGYAILLAMVVLPVVMMFVIEPVRPQPVSNIVEQPLGRAVSPRPPHEADLTTLMIDDQPPHEADLAALTIDNQPLHDGGFGETALPLVARIADDQPLRDEGRAVSPRPPHEADLAALTIDNQPLRDGGFGETALPSDSRFSLSDCVPYLPLLSYGWFFGVALMSIRLCLGLWEIRLLRRNAFLIADGRWEDALRKAATRLGLRRKIRLRGSVQIGSPLMIGVFRPMILVPLGMLSNLSPEQVEIILLHELAHVKRHDYLANLLQLVVETLLFYHPLVWWVSNSVRRDREYLCDDVVVHRGLVDNLVYAQTLTDLETFRQKEGLDMKRIYSAPAAAAKPLLNRIKRIMNMKPDRDRRSDCLAGLVALAILAALPVWAVFFDSNRPPIDAVNAAVVFENEKTTETQNATISQNEPEEIQLEVYSLEKILAAEDFFNAAELEEPLQEYLVHSYTGKYNRETGVFPATCKAKGHLLIVMATAKQQEQIAAFLEKLEASAAKPVKETESQKLVAAPSAVPAYLPQEPVPARSESVSLSPYPATAPGHAPGYEVRPAQPQQFPQPQYYVPGEDVPPAQPPQHSLVTVPAPNDLQQQVQPQAYNVVVEQPDGSVRTQEPYVIAMPFANRKAKDFLELVLCDEDFADQSGTMFVDERSNTFLWLVSEPSDPVTRAIYRGMCQLFDQPELPDTYPDLETFLAEAESAVVETYSLKHRSAANLCHFFNANMQAARSVIVNEQSYGGRDSLPQIAFFVDESDKTLIVARDTSASDYAFEPEYLQNSLAKYDVPQTAENASQPVPQEGRPVVQAFQLHNRSTAEFAILLRNFINAIDITNGEKLDNVDIPNKQKPGNSVNVYFDEQTQTVVVCHYENNIYEELPSIVSFYNAKPEAISYAYANLSEYFAKNPGAKAKSFSVKNYPVESLCHFWRCYMAGFADHEGASKFAFFADEKSKKLVACAPVEADDLFACLTKFIALCDSKESAPQLQDPYVPSTKAPSFSPNEPVFEYTPPKPELEAIPAEAPRAAEVTHMQPVPVFPVDASEIVAVPFVNRKAKDLLELLTCYEAFATNESYPMFVDEGSNTFIWLNTDRSHPSTMIRLICRLFDQPESPDVFPDLQAFLAQAGSAVVETYPLNHRSAEDVCHFYRVMLAILVERELVSLDDPEAKLPLAFFADESGKTLIVARDTSAGLYDPVSSPEFLAKYDVPQTTDRTSQETGLVVQSFRLQNRSTAGFAMLLRNYTILVSEENGEEPKNLVYFDPQTQTMVVMHQNAWLIDILPNMVSLYDAQGTISYAFTDLSDFLTKNPGAKAVSFQVKNHSAETLCHFWRCYAAGNANHEDASKYAFFADEKSKKLITCAVGEAYDLFESFARFIELCDGEEIPQLPMPSPSATPLPGNEPVVEEAAFQVPAVTTSPTRLSVARKSSDDGRYVVIVGNFRKDVTELYEMISAMSSVSRDFSLQVSLDVKTQSLLIAGSNDKEFENFVGFLGHYDGQDETHNEDMNALMQKFPYDTYLIHNSRQSRAGRQAGILIRDFFRAWFRDKPIIVLYDENASRLIVLRLDKSHSPENIENFLDLYTRNGLLVGLNESVSKGYFVGDLITASTGETDFSGLISLIRETITPDDWTDDESEGNTISPVHAVRTLVIKAPEETHEQIADLFAQLRKVHNQTAVLLR